MDEFRILFRLRDTDAIPAWGEPGYQSLHWFGLTDGCACIATPAGRLMEMPQPAPGYPEPWCDYAVARLFEDLLAGWRDIAEPVPDDIAAPADNAAVAARLDAAWGDDDALADIAGRARAWWDARQVSIHHLASAPRLHLWRRRDTLHLRWIANPGGQPGHAGHWTVARADCALPFAPAEQAVYDFARDFLAAMAERVAAIRRDGWWRDCTLDVGELAREQAAREAWAGEMLEGAPAATDWAAVRALYRRLGL